MSTSIQISSIIGNIKRDSILRARYEEMSRQGLCEIVKINRIESERVRMRKVTDKGSDVIITLPQGSRLRHGDVIHLSNERMVVVELEEENLAMIKIKDDTPVDHVVEIAVRVGHTIGNLHRPIKVEDRSVYFPIQADTEMEMIKRLLNPILDHLVIEKTRMVFEPEEGVEVHEH
ncbi:Urease accessory protein UreE [archaeon HR04]|nr:Urease accessory protein UreE [archaeon HR04]